MQLSYNSFAVAVATKTTTKKQKNKTKKIGVGWGGGGGGGGGTVGTIISGNPQIVTHTGFCKLVVCKIEKLPIRYLPNYSIVILALYLHLATDNQLAKPRKQFPPHLPQPPQKEP